MALSADSPLKKVLGEVAALPVAASTKIYEGAMVGLTSGYARGLVSGDQFQGHAISQADNSAVATDGAINVNVMAGRYQLQVTLTGVAVTDVGKAVFATADDTLSLTNSGSFVGVVRRYVAANTAIVEFFPGWQGQFIGNFASAAAGAGVPLVATTRTAAFRVYADDGGAAIGAGSYRAAVARMLITTALGATDTSIAGFQGQIKISADVDAATGGGIVGVWAYCECDTDASVALAAAIRATADLPVGAVIASGGRLAGIMIDSITLGGTHTGIAACIYVPNPLAGTWDYFLDFGSAPGCIAEDTSNLPTAATHKIKCRIGATDFYLIGVADF